jgi:hypothetical protein
MEVDRFARRVFLRGAAGLALAVPALESWPFARAFAEPKGKLPLRILFVYVPNGMHLPDWRPAAEGAEFEMPKTLQVLEPFRKKLLVLSGLTVDGARPKGDGAGDHARAGAAFLTCAHPRKTDGADIEAGTSVDQLAARALGEGTAFPSVELGTDASAQGGNCDSGYSCAYSSNLSWSSPTSPMAKEINPRRAFTRLFLDGEGLTPGERAKRDRYRASVLDAVKEDAKRVESKLGSADKRKLDEYLESVRALEKRLDPKAKSDRKSSNPVPPPSGIPSDYGEHIRLLYDVIRVAFETDTTRVVTFMCGNEGSNRSYPSIGVPDGHHEISHHGGDAGKQAKIAKINRFHTEQLAYFLGELEKVKEGQGTLLDQTLVVFGSAIADGDRHNHDDLPILVAGRGAGTLASGRHVRYRKETPLANLYLGILQRAGAKVEKFADSTEALPGLI